MYPLLDYDGNFPAYVLVTDGKTADNIPLLPNSVIVTDRFYNAFSLLKIWDSNEAYFVIRHKENLQYETIRENELPEGRHEHILKDEIIQLPPPPSTRKNIPTSFEEWPFGTPKTSR